MYDTTNTSSLVNMSTGFYIVVCMCHFVESPLKILLISFLKYQTDKFFVYLGVFAFRCVTVLLPLYLPVIVYMATLNKCI